tara:strand:- start:1891 stop:2007 length:117 start_codon:yes stop_codon:yes gene_type:complete
MQSCGRTDVLLLASPLLAALELLLAVLLALLTAVILLA